METLGRHIYFGGGEVQGKKETDCGKNYLTVD